MVQTRSGAGEPILGVLIGQGNNGSVFQCLKHADRVIKRTWRIREHWEIQLANACAPEVSPTFYSQFVHDLASYVEMEKVDGPTVAQFLHVEHSAREWDEFDTKLSVFVEYMKQPQRFIYRDWKFENVMVGPSRIVLVDWADTVFLPEHIYSNFPNLKSIWKWTSTSHLPKSRAAGL